MQSKNDCCSEYRKFKVKIQNFDNDILKLFSFSKTTLMKNEILKIVDLQDKRAFDQEKERHDIFNQIQNLRKEIKKFKDKLKQGQNNYDFNAKIQELSENLSQKTNLFKEKQMLIFEQMQEEEELLNYDLMNFLEKQNRNEQNIQKIEQIQEADESLSEDSGDSEQSSNDVKQIDDQYQIQKIEKKLEKLKLEIDKIDKQIKVNGNYNCGWPQEDHQDFLKLKTKYKDNIKDEQFLNVLLQKMPIYSEDQIQEHISKYLKYVRYENQKKEILDQYKNQKQLKDQLNINQVNEKNERQLLQEKVMQQQKLEKEKQKKDQLKSQLNEWKVRRQSSREVRQEATDFLMQDKHIETEKSRLDKLLKHQLIQDYKERKQMDAQLKQEREQQIKQMKKVQIDPQEQERLKQKEEQLLQKKKYLVQMQQNKKLEQLYRKEQLLTQQNPKFDNIESKLNEHTMASKDKYRLKFDPLTDQAKYANTFGGNLLHLQRAVPNWRKNN